MKSCLMGSLILAMVMPAGAQEPSTQASMNGSVAIQGGSTNRAGEAIEEYLNPGEPIRVDAGRKFALRIMSNPTTGYGWQLSKPLDENVVVLVTNIYLQQQTVPERVGVSGHEVWTFQAIGQGQTEISLKYVRPWEKDRPPARTNCFTVIVK